MAIYLVSYDLLQPGQKYAQLHAALRSVPHCKPLSSVWFIQHQGGAAAVRDWLSGYIDRNDRLFVTRQSADWAGYAVQNQCGDWVNQQPL